MDHPEPPGGRGKVGEVHGSREKLHPLMVDLILENVFQYLNKGRLDVCRSVCSTWYSNSLPFWVQKSPHIQMFGKAGVVSNGQEEDRPGLEISQFLRVVNNESYSYFEGARQCCRFTLSQCTMGKESVLLNTFWGGFGDTITHLTLDNFVFQDMTLFADIMFSKFTPNLEKLQTSFCFTFKKNLNVDYYQMGNVKTLDGSQKQLKSLGLKYPRPRPQNTYCHLSLQWFDLLNYYPHLQDLAVDCFDSEPGKILHIINEIRGANQQKLVLKSVDLGPYPNYYSSLLSFLTHANLHLEILDLDLQSWAEEDELVFEEIIWWNAESLERLTIRSLQNPFLEESPFEYYQPPSMMSMKDLTLFGYPFGSYAFLRSFKSLETLNLLNGAAHLGSYDRFLVLNHRGNLMNAANNILMRPVVIPTLTKFCCEYDGIWSRRDVLELHGWMPNLKELKMYLANESLRAVCTCWPKLETLWILGRQVDDEGITGWVLQKNGAAQIYPNITSLQELRTLVMENKWEGTFSRLYPTAITAKSVYDGFLKLGKLERLEITVDQDQMDPQTVRVLKARIESAKVHIVSCPRDMELDFYLTMNQWYAQEGGCGWTRRH